LVSHNMYAAFSLGSLTTNRGLAVHVLGEAWNEQNFASAYVPEVC
jgi:hypothetical protein